MRALAALQEGIYILQKAKAMPTSQEECPTCFTTPNCPTMGENHFLSLPHPMQRRGTAKDREIQHRA